MTSYLRETAARLARVRGDDLAYAEGQRTRTWAEIHQRACRLARGFQDLGIEAGQRVGIISQDHIEMIDHWHACFRGGMVRVGINWRYSPREVNHIVEDADLKLILIQDNFVDTLADHLEDWTAVGRILVGYGQTHGLEYDLEEIIASHEPDYAEPVLEPRSPVAISYTSGSTGMPKGAVLTQVGAATQIVTSPYSAGFTSDDVILNNLPGSGFPIFIHTYGMSSGATTVLPGLFNAEETIETVERRGVTVMFCVPTMLNAIEQKCRAQRRHLPSLRTVVLLGSPVVPAIVERAHETFDCTFQNWYGSTEATGAIVMERDLLGNLEADGPAPVGRPLLHVDVEIHDDQDHPAVQGTTGEICVRGPVIDHYHNMPEATAEAFRNGWFHMGDMGYQDENGRIHLTDRKNFMIISGGYNVYPAVVENVLASHPGVDEVAVVGAAHPRWGEAVVAVVVPTPGRCPAPDELVEFCRSHVGLWEVPRHVEFVDELPVGSTGKIQKRELARKFRENPDRLEWNRENATT
ncbi:class I adenylate-forming enzyme family protein [Nocardia vaccinii]|uniref:class I adenylate-forming enzyme family protein n=1 Tax=Nocardia vaccinii TaxID=1822 RepID=UPI000A06B289|nr:class I adenylate-forming enzyme family protein [Nocardia vaccinii]